LPTLVRDYRPPLEAVGFAIERSDDVTGHADRELVLFRAIAERADQLRAEMGAAADLILDEAADRLANANKPRRVRTRWIVAIRR
jgi:hypothetical protein